MVNGGIKRRISPGILFLGAILIIAIVALREPFQRSVKGDKMMEKVSLIVGEGEQSTDASLGVLLTGEPSLLDGAPADYAYKYILEILGHAKVPFQKISGKASDFSKYAVIVMPGNLALSAETKAGLRDYVAKGGNLIGIGGTSGLDEVFGAKTSGYVESGYIRVREEEASNPLVSGMESSLHTFRITCLTATGGRPLAGLLDENHEATGYDAIILNRYGDGLAMLYGPDLVYSILHIQQGIEIRKDGVPAPDGSAPIDDGILKTDDGMVLDWEWDRTTIEDAKFFAYPIADELRELILKAIFYAFSAKGDTLPMVWYWKDGLEAVGLISHDSDGNVPNLAEKLHENLMSLDIKSTWCIQYPGGYPSQFYTKLKETGYEIALHYDARTGREYTTWTHDNFKYQEAWLRKTAAISRIESNKNHYLRWEGYLEFFRWLEEAGIQADQCKGPSKKGNVGFIFGGSHPWTPMDEKDGNFIDVLEINLATQDLVLTCPYIVGPTVVDQAIKHNGIAHFLFHPAHVLKPGIADAMKNVVNYGREKGLEWWTSREINAWERTRRNIRMSGAIAGDKEIRFTVEVPFKVEGLTLRLMVPSQEGIKAVKINGKEAEWEAVSYLGFDFIQFITAGSGRLSVTVER